MEQVTIKTKMDEGAMTAFFREVNSKRRTLWIVIFALILAGIAAYTVDIYKTYGYLNEYFCVAGVLALYMLLRVIFAPSQWRKNARKLVEKNGEGEMTLTFTEDSFVSESEWKYASHRSERKYECVTRVVERKDYLFAYMTDNQVLVIKRADIPEDRLPVLRNLLGSRLPEDRYVIK